MTFERATTARVTKRFRVRDAGTGARLVVVHDFDCIDDWVRTEMTDAAGVATFRLAEEYLHLLRVNVSADGYVARHALSVGDATTESGTGRISDDPINIDLWQKPE